MILLFPVIIYWKVEPNPLPSHSYKFLQLYDDALRKIIFKYEIEKKKKKLKILFITKWQRNILCNNKCECESGSDFDMKIY